MKTPKYWGKFDIFAGPGNKMMPHYRLCKMSYKLAIKIHWPTNLANCFSYGKGSKLVKNPVKHTSWKLIMPFENMSKIHLIYDIFKNFSFLFLC